MAKNVRFELNLKGLNELMKSPEITEAVYEAGKAVAEAAGEGYAAEVHQARYISISNVYGETEKAKRENLRDNTLLKAVGAVGLSQTKGKSK